MKSALEILKEVWNYDAFRDIQQDIVENAIAGNDTLALLPTGGGKSICYQVPGLARGGLCLVISPLIALMKDQVEQLVRRGVEAVAIFSGMSYREIDLELDNCIAGKYKFLYVSPERLKTDIFLARVQNMNIKLVAIDEAHCLSQWGYDFRPEYLQIADLRNLLPDVPFMALTASATPAVVKDIAEKLKLKQFKIYKKSFARDNLSYIVLNEENKWERMMKIFKNIEGTGIVYVRNRKKTEEIARELKRNGFSADFYHAGLDHKIRNKKQEDWINNKIRIIASTNAFGMGIDKPDVRVVVHFEAPDSLESYYQEAGRAGRDGNEAWCVLLFNEADHAEALERMNAAFPDTEDITRVYEALNNHLQIPLGAGKDVSYDFDIARFARSFNLNPLLVFHALKILESGSVLKVNESVFHPAKLKILVDPTTLYDFQLKNAEYDSFIKLILRSYGGAFDFYVEIKPDDLAHRMNINLHEVYAKLEYLHQSGFIDFQRQKDQPQILFLIARSREPIVDWYFYDRKMESTENQLNNMLFYAENQLICRSKIIQNYFGESDAEDCGKCDVCRAKLKAAKSIGPGKWEMYIREKILAGYDDVKSLASAIPTMKEDELINYLRILLDDKRIFVDEYNRLQWVG